MNLFYYLPECYDTILTSTLMIHGPCFDLKPILKKPGRMIQVMIFNVLREFYSKSMGFPHAHLLFTEINTVSIILN